VRGTQVGACSGRGSRVTTDLGDPTDTRLGLAALVRAVPVGALVAVAWVLAWDTSGSIRASDWLPYAVGVTLVLAAVLLAGAAALPARLSLAAALLLIAFAAWTAASAAWSPVPSLARDDGLLALFYAIALLTPLVTLRTAADRLAATVVVVAGLSVLAVWTAVWLREGGDPELLYFSGRLDFPVSYWNGEAAMTLVAFWPAVALSARREIQPVIRAIALGGATAMLALWLGTQSKGGGVALAISGIVVFALCRRRLRLLLPTAIAAGLAAAGAVALTEPFRTDGPAFDDAVRSAGTVTLVLSAIGACLGLVYALGDRRIRVSEWARRLIGRAVLVLLAAGIVAGLGGFFATVEHPVASTQQRWEEFKRLDPDVSSASHFGSLGSNRYDFWRVAWNEFERHPVVGIGAYGWGNAYLRHGSSDETPQRAHSLEMDALSETGVVGFLLVVSAGVLALVAVARRARFSLMAAGAVGTAAYFAVHTGGDWVWTIPAVGVAAFAIVGIGASGDRSTPMSARVALPAGIVAVAVALVAFAPPWLSSRLVDRAYDAPAAAAAANDLRWARRLDPLAVEPLIAESALATPPANLAPLRRAVAKQPRDSELRYLLGLALLDLKRSAAAQRELGIALELSPRDEAILAALRDAR
jgi:hypothetical protein